MATELTMCARCNGETRRAEIKISWFTGDPICDDCAALEKELPNFFRAHLAGLQSLEAGGSIEGFGFAEEDLQNMLRKRKQRAQTRAQTRPRRKTEEEELAYA